MAQRDSKPVWRVKRFKGVVVALVFLAMVMCKIGDGLTNHRMVRWLNQ